ncbi:nuclear transport factor 2 family protein [Streptomyces griseosporeus]|uniref:nuclear transport factor 2 family protein n=1 Tax=Streptomyces griseosporeus TaxID=1910 RepID=UPI00167DD4C4|nr:nuclear transport factor 2 family protein [Streptomyces griseosporeus]GHF67607.1 hypothetical protein GCM10018783_41130 [Streptomyces griseosporeus]
MRRPAVLAAAVAALAVAAGAAALTGGDLLGGDTDGAAARPPAASRTSPARSLAPSALHPAARRYFDAVAGEDADAVAAAFAADGLVVDVGREIRGRDAIRQWAADEVVGGDYTVLDHTPHTTGTTLLVRFRPGGTGDGFRARYRFDITDGLITRATLEYA